VGSHCAGVASEFVASGENVTWEKNGDNTRKVLVGQLSKSEAWMNRTISPNAKTTVDSSLACGCGRFGMTSDNAQVAA
jgi:hypothetical protein